MDPLEQNLYIFTLGRLTELSIAELEALSGSNCRIFDREGSFAIMSFQKPLQDPQKTLNMLGGTIKISKVFHEIQLSANKRAENLSETASTVITHRILEKFESSSSKINYGISVHNISDRNENILRSSLKNIKKNLTANSRSSRFVNKDFQNVHNVVVAQEDLINKGMEAVMAKIGDKIYIGETVAIQDFISYEHRDYDRPAINMESGMLPPKIAQIMINLSGVNGDGGNKKDIPTIYDPFCGNGTIPSEALLMGAHVIGSDKSEIAVKDTQINIDWLTKEYELIGAKSHVFQADATKISATDLPINISEIDAIVFESYLGPRITKRPTPEEISKISTELGNLYAETLRNFHKLGLKCPIIMAIAAFRDNNKYNFIENFPERAHEFGFKIVPLSKKPRSSLIYDRPDQFVAREIFRIEPKIN